MQGPSDIYVKVGSQVILTCIVSQGPHELGTIFWYRGKDFPICFEEFLKIFMQKHASLLERNLFTLSKFVFLHKLQVLQV